MLIANLLTDDLKSTRDLFVEWLDFEVEYEADWFICMFANGKGRVSAFRRTSEFIPKAYQRSVQGIILTIVVDDVEPYFERAQKLDLNIVESPRDLPYGQRRFLVADASGALIDVSAPTAQLEAEFAP